MRTFPPGIRALLLAGLAASALLPMLLLIAYSLGRNWFWPALLPERWSLDTWAALFGGGRLLPATRNSVGLAVGTGALACLVSLPAGRALAELRGWRRHLGAAAIFLPVAAPPIALAVGLQYSFLTVGLSGNLAGVLLAHLIPAAGYVSLFFLGIFSVFDARIEEEARSLGATPRQVLTRVTLPLLRRPLIEGFVLGFLISWAQVPLTLLIGRGAVPTLPLEVFAYVGAGQDHFAAAGALLLIAPPLAAMAAAGFAIRRTEVIPV